MALAPRRNDEDATPRQLTSGSRHGGPRPSEIQQPPFIADVVKRSVLYHIESYQRISDQSRLRTRPPSETATHRPDGLDEEELAFKRKIVQRKLMNDLRRLLAGIGRLERLLRRGRLLRWLVNGTLAALWHAVVLNMMAPFSRRYLKPRALRVQLHPQMHVHLHVPTTYLATMAYLVSLPLFGFPLLNYEKQLSCTVVIRDELEDIYGLVRDGAALDHRDVEVLRGSRWDAVPWDKVEGYLEY
ncbi:hypothetical protein PV04_04465 [Phialophora macrospora]|uniref:Uncharacterized protein n=1 Tax=Phialophora macrospora TaxID=1851006 RepID=A0A0D2CTN3_9EURO|nr:hypothetical protein PV04_04465 [Phialophora macrospora]